MNVGASAHRRRHQHDEHASVRGGKLHRWNKTSPECRDRHLIQFCGCGVFGDYLRSQHR